jgi:hypothetical protein
MKLRIVLITGLGLALALYLVMYVGVGAVFSAAIAVGWSGFAILCLYALGVFLLLGCAWYVLLPDSSSTRPWVLVWARMVRDAAAEVLPFSQLGGMLFGVRAAILHGVATSLAFASMIVDVTTEMLAQIIYVALGVVLLSARAPRSSLAVSLTTLFLIGLVLATSAGVLFVAVQRYGHRITETLAARILPGAVAPTAALAARLDAIASAMGTWIAFRLIGAHVDIASALAIESLVYATRSAAAFIPNALGVQEAAYTLLAPLFGIGVESALAVSLLKRARDVAVGAPILVIWQAVEGRRAVAAGPAATN